MVTPAWSQVLLNELQASNSSTIADPDNGEYSDWLEIFNDGTSPVNLSGWRLSDSGDNTEWSIPSGTILPADSFLLIWADGTGTGLHTSFSLSADGEELTLYNNAGTKVDFIAFPAQLTDVSYGRETNGASTWGFFNQPTPRKSNNTSTLFLSLIHI